MTLAASTSQVSKSRHCLLNDEWLTDTQLYKGVTVAWTPKPRLCHATKTWERIPYQE